MRQWVAGGLVLAFVAAFVQAPWAHVHEHHYDADHDRRHGAVAIHGHDHHALRPETVPGTFWRDRSADEDARALGPMTAVRDGAPPPDLAAARVGPIAPVEPVTIAWFADPTPQSHGPPGLGRLIPRAPPA
jgi:hypothetical protein